MKPSMTVKQWLYVSLIAALGIAVTLLVTVLIGTSLVETTIAAVIGVAASGALGTLWPSPQEREGDEENAALRRRMAKFESPERIVEDQRQWNRRRRTVKPFGSRDS